MDDAGPLERPADVSVPHPATLQDPRENTSTQTQVHPPPLITTRAGRTSLRLSLRLSGGREGTVVLPTFLE